MVKKLASHIFPSRSRKKKTPILRECCKTHRGFYHRPDCPIGFPVINKQTEESLELWVNGTQVPMFQGNQI